MCIHGSFVEETSRERFKSEKLLLELCIRHFRCELTFRIWKLIPRNDLWRKTSFAMKIGTSRWRILEIVFSCQFRTIGIKPSSPNRDGCESDTCFKMILHLNNKWWEIKLSMLHNCRWGFLRLVKTYFAQETSQLNCCTLVGEGKYNMIAMKRQWTEKEVASFLRLVWLSPIKRRRHLKVYKRYPFLVK